MRTRALIRPFVTASQCGLTESIKRLAEMLKLGSGRLFPLFDPILKEA